MIPAPVHHTGVHTAELSETSCALRDRFCFCALNNTRSSMLCSAYLSCFTEPELCYLLGPIAFVFHDEAGVFTGVGSRCLKGGRGRYQSQAGVCLVADGCLCGYQWVSSGLLDDRPCGLVTVQTPHKSVTPTLALTTPSSRHLRTASLASG